MFRWLGKCWNWTNSAVTSAALLIVPAPLRRWLHKWRWWIWACSTLGWAVLLVVPIPQGDFLVFENLEINLRAIFAKVVHVSMYAVLTAWAGWMAAPIQYRFFLVFSLMAHATLTEVVQRLMRDFGRNGTLFDVAWDHLGIAIGIAISWRWWTQKDSVDW